ncbi:hypothetical protein RBH29_04750 [Herbivorax sp. ANBcel31]|nr:hypothetical protein [Herbivorax sp. ANBcel31]MDQ2085743.1 hypothetical protein [Herbivorax sp. ANBcel31]
MVIKEPNTIRKKGIEVLSRELGPLGMTYFIRQFDSGESDYTKERAEIQESTNVKEIVEEIYRRRK